VRHILATVASDRILVKASFARPLDRLPQLHVGNRKSLGFPTDTALRFSQFDVRRGHDLHRPYVSLETRQRLLHRGLGFAPDAVVAVGDQIAPLGNLRARRPRLLRGRRPRRGPGHLSRR
jgi:hypothetical protein